MIQCVSFFFVLNDKIVVCQYLPKLIFLSATSVVEVLLSLGKHAASYLRGFAVFSLHSSLLLSKDRHYLREHKEM